MPMHTPRYSRAPGAALLLLVTMACVPSSGLGICLELDGPCSGQSSGGGGSFTSRIYVLGLPADRVDRATPLPGGSYRAILHVGDAISLQLMLAVGDTTDGSGVPIQGARWALADSSTAHIEPAANGAGILTAVAAGPVKSVIGNDVPYHEIASCDAQKQCVRVTEIDLLQ